ncbi:hypothetical protein T459_14770 [Capsicum annuum]|uniref:Uncharacterized protein n=1 Tax=Capsicum annuum TaxID=4072 RepID=A0A2G2ZIK3_CAPAN|nr:uncharacterized protein LOC107843504 [Capsicum annuum]PHT81755.1 hypothetical protein T459_14770 [Capsicum annuum]
MATLLRSPDISSFSSSRINVKKLILPNGGRRVVRVCSSSLKDLEDVGVLYGQFSGSLKLNTVSSSTKLDKEEEQKRNYYMNTGSAIRILREEFPALFYKEMNYDIYRDDIVFKDPLNTFTGIENYKSIFWALRFHGRIFFRALWIDIVSVWQPVEGMIMIRWTVHGIPRVPWESRGRFDGTSEYKLDKDGKIYEHRVHNIALKGPPKFHVLAVQELIGYIGHPTTPKPTFFKVSFPYLVNMTPVVKFADLDITWVQFLASVKRGEKEQLQQE